MIKLYLKQMSKQIFNIKQQSVYRLTMGSETSDSHFETLSVDWNG